MDYNLVSTVGTLAKAYLLKKKPSELIPFKGDFPLMKNFEYPHLIEDMDKTMLLSDLKPEYQEAIRKGFQIYLLENGFKEYLENDGTELSKFLSLDNSNKSTKLIDFLNKNCIDFTSLTIK